MSESVKFENTMPVPAVPDTKQTIRAQLGVSVTMGPRVRNAGPGGGDCLDFIASTGALDRYGEVIEPKGWKLDYFRQNPVFQNAHRYGDVLFTLGRAIHVDVRTLADGRDALTMRVEFATQVNPVARVAYGLYQGGFLNAVSVGFIPLRWVAQASGAAVVLAHHFAKGEAGAKEAIDRMSGAGAWARDPDALVVLTPHEEEDCFTVSTILRHMKRIPDWVVGWEYPLMRRLNDLNPEALRSRMGRKRIYRDAEFQRIVLTKPKSLEAIVKDGAMMGLAERTVKRYLYRLMDTGVVVKGNGLYWAKEEA